MNQSTATGQGHRGAALPTVMADRDRTPRAPIRWPPRTRRPGPPARRVPDLAGLVLAGRPAFHRPIPGGPSAGPGGIRAGLPGARRRPRPPRGDQGPQPRARRRPRRHRCLPGRSTHRRPARPPAHRPRARRGPNGRRALLRRLPVHGGRRSGGAAAPGTADVPGVGRAGGDGRRGAAPRAHPRPGAPRPQAGQHPARLRRPSLRGRFRASAAGRGLRQGRRDGGHSGLHEPRAGAGRGAPGRRPLGHLQPGRGLLRAAHGRRPFRGPSLEELSHQIQRAEERPPRQIDDTIPRELERICQTDAGEAGVGAVQHGPRPGRGLAAVPPGRRRARAFGERARPRFPAARLDP